MTTSRNILLLLAALTVFAGCSDDAALTGPDAPERAPRTTLNASDAVPTVSLADQLLLAKKGNKLEVCHVDQDTGDIKLISVGSEKAAEKHLANHTGDGVPGAGYTATCEPDADSDGTPDASDAFPKYPTETADSDGDGVGDNADAFPNDPSEQTDRDGDGIGDNSDPYPDDPENGGGTCGPTELPAQGTPEFYLLDGSQVTKAEFFNQTTGTVAIRVEAIFGFVQVTVVEIVQNIGTRFIDSRAIYPPDLEKYQAAFCELVEKHS